MHTVSLQLNGKEYSLETGRFAKLAQGAVMVRYADTMVLVTVCASSESRDLDFVPLTVEYREKTAASGKIPGGFFKREGKPSDKEVLSARLIDRPVRPLFPKTWRHETQIVATVFSSDQLHDSDTLAAVGASAAIMLSGLPFKGPFAEVSIGRVNGEFILNPSFKDLEESDLEMIVAGTDDEILMVEGSSKEISEEDFIAAIEFAQGHIKLFTALQRELMALVGASQVEHTEPEVDETLVEAVKAIATPEIHAQIRTNSSKEIRSAFRKELSTKVLEAINTNIPLESESEIATRNKTINKIIGKIEKAEMRRMILDENRRLDGRTTTDIRPITSEVGILPRTHGSALFTRGETQSLTSVTLGTKDDEQIIDGLLPTYFRRFMLHYNFPPYSTGEVGRMTGTSRRETGHGNLAERAVKIMSPNETEFPYVIRIVSDILESNGSSSMATVCASSLALWDAGVPLKKAVSGIAMGLIKEGDEVAVLSDILGDEDFLGDMDFKVAGTADGITACQMDIKIAGLSMDILRKALHQARDGRLHILSKMNEALSEPRQDLSPYAPRLTTIQIPVESIGAVIGSGGSVIRALCLEFGVEINIQDDGTVVIAATDGEAALKTVQRIESIIRPPEVGMVYNATVKEVREGLGAICEFMPKTKGLLHISQISYEPFEYVGDILKNGQQIEVKLIEIQSDGKFRLSRKALLEKPEGYVEREQRPREPRRDDDRRGGGDRRDDRRGGGDDRRGGYRR
ncbi:MAG: polyribonucleotide nucleotidyltransferase [Bacteroidetes bacterium]|nr:polyribonucleotide nucleotidyltransferase [Bacteroidota bacterium]